MLGILPNWSHVKPFLRDLIEYRKGARDATAYLPRTGLAILKAKLDTELFPDAKQTQWSVDSVTVKTEQGNTGHTEYNEKRRKELEKRYVDLKQSTMLG